MSALDWMPIGHEVLHDDQTLKSLEQNEDEEPCTLI